MGFREFIRIFSGLNSPLGDFTRDVLRDPDFNDRWVAGQVQEHFDLVLTDIDQQRMARALTELYRYV